jgi:SAM-dependent methyltransferase
LGALQGYYAIEILVQLHKLGILKLLEKPKTARRLAELLGLNGRMLDCLLQFVARSTDLFECSNGSYSLKSGSSAQMRFQLEKFSCAYAPSLQHIARLLRKNKAPRVDDLALARAFASFEESGEPVATMARKAGVKRLLDLGCGPAWLLVALAGADPRFEGFGIDKSRAMCRVARRNVRQTVQDSRIHIKAGDARRPEKLLSAVQRSGIEAVHGSSFLNEFFASGENGVIEVLRHLRRQFPGRIAWFVDYYGELGSERGRLRQHRLTLLQDVAQIASLQGVPPSRLQDWERIHKKAGCRLMEVQEFQSDEIIWFIHTVQF